MVDRSEQLERQYRAHSRQMSLGRTAPAITMPVTVVRRPREEMSAVGA
jgi:hypothetical protein